MPKLVFTAAAQTDRGLRREENEDNLYVDGLMLPTDSPQQPFCSGERRLSLPAVVGLSDGMGGESEGAFASATAMSVLAERAVSLSAATTEAWPLAVRDYVRQANAEICQRMRQTASRIGATVALLLLTETGVQAFNIGDSRIYLLRAGELKQLSRDHTEVERMMRIGGVSREDAIAAGNAHVLTQYLGIFEEELILSPYAAQLLQPQVGDVFLLCSDGLTDMLSDANIAEYLMREKTPAATAADLIAAALGRGGVDNITVLVLSITRPPTLLSRLLNPIAAISPMA